jgi:exonuclease SbcC
MDDASFRASVFAEQKQVSAFSEVATEKRRELVLRLLGITPLDKARDLARSEARDHKKLHEQLQQRLPDLEELRAKLAAAEDAATGAVSAAESLTKQHAAATAARDKADFEFETTDGLRTQYEDIVRAGLTSKKLLEESTARLTKLEEEQSTLATASTKVAELRPLVAGLAARVARVAALRAVDAAERTLAALPKGDAPTEPDDSPLEAARAAVEAATAEAADLAGELRAAVGEHARAEEAASRSGELSADEDCPMCGQALGDAFEQVQSHRKAEVDAAATRVKALEKQQAAAAKTLTAARKTAETETAAFKKAQAVWSTWQEQATRRASAEEALAAALAGLDTKPKKGELDALAEAVDAGKKAERELQKLEGQLLRHGAVEAEIAALGTKVDELTTEVDALRTKLKALKFDKDALEQAKVARDAARKQADALAQQAQEATIAAARRQADLELAKSKLAEGEQAHAELQVLVDEVRHTTRTAELLSEFRNTVVQAIGPQLAAQAADLFAELTDHEYETLDVDPNTFDIKISDAGVAHGLARFSGSETDLANLALRVAISEHVRFQSGGAVGLLVLDEVFGPLDPDRKERMLQALNRLGSRFRQVLVITHDESIKEQLPSAIEVVKLPGRRATARVLSGI